jgi:hypothetical protein
MEELQDKELEDA